MGVLASGIQPARSVNLVSFYQTEFVNPAQVTRMESTVPVLVIVYWERTTVSRIPEAVKVPSVTGDGLACQTVRYPV